MTRLTFTAIGEPAPQGSKTRLPTGGMREANPRTAPWRATLAAAAHTALNGHQPLTGPLELTAVFIYPRPASHYRTGRHAGQLKTTAPNLVTRRPDLDKLLRAVGDALTGIAYHDDAQLALITAEKRYGTPPSAHIVIETIEPQAESQP